jgi:hypothetical protein
VTGGKRQDEPDVQFGMRSPNDYTERELQDMFFRVTQEHAEQLGPELTRQLGELLMGIRYWREPWPPSIIERVRWAAFCGGIEAVGWGDKGKQAGMWAARQLKGTWAAGGAHSMILAYKEFSKSHPAERRTRTWRRRGSLR